MILTDVNILVYAHREDSAKHLFYYNWLLSVVNSKKNFAYSDIILSGFIRIVSHPKIFKTATSIQTAFEFCQTIRESVNAVCITPGVRHWDIFHQLALLEKAKGNLIPDCFIAALAIEHGCTLATSDRDFKRFDDLDLQIID